MTLKLYFQFTSSPNPVIPSSLQNGFLLSFLSFFLFILFSSFCLILDITHLLSALLCTHAPFLLAFGLFYLPIYVLNYFNFHIFSLPFLPLSFFISDLCFNLPLLWKSQACPIKCCSKSV
jgi:hypothetical protein